MRVYVELLDNFPFDVVDLATFLRPAKEDDAGYDLVSAEDVTLLPGERRLVRTGVAVALTPLRCGCGIDPTSVPVMHISPRSGVALRQGLTLVNSPGVVDAGFRAEVGLIVLNTNPVVSVAALQKLSGQGYPLEARALWKEEVEQNTIQIKRGDRIAQAVFSQAARPVFHFVETLEDSDRGHSGFGSSGR